MVKAAGLFEEFEHSERFLLCILNEPYMPLVVASWPTPDALKGEQRRVLIAHYYRRANRTYPDPALEMTDMGFPIRLLQAVFGIMESRVLWRNPETQQVMINIAAKRGMAELLGIWAKNIKQQGFIEAAKRIAANGGPFSIPAWIDDPFQTDVLP